MNDTGTGIETNLGLTVASDREARAAARTAARAEREAEMRALSARHDAALDAIAGILADDAVGIRADDGALTTALREAFATYPALPKRAASILANCRLVTHDSLALTGNGRWIRQFDRWVRDPIDLTVGSYACGRTGQPRKTRQFFILGFLTYRGESHAIKAETQAQDAGSIAAELVAMVLTEARQRAAALTPPPG